MYLQFTKTKKSGLKSNQNRGTATEQIELEEGEIIYFFRSGGCPDRLMANPQRRIYYKLLRATKP
jgi:hypothetical protein